MSTTADDDATTTAPTATTAPSGETCADLIKAMREECGISKYRLDKSKVIALNHQQKIESGETRVTVEILTRYITLAREWSAAHPGKRPGPATRRLIAIGKVLPPV